ncbi:hypothetical protein FB192DRAFT_1420100 [Mucor lusitanicus]|uniref:RWD domain-containing protein n=1 Tax=Mucor circinelloides f. lusitanicus TaxID=29924 RepID=A0A8H4BUG3_MUCCL|nr:hypothetical protein FB192DRAFT_1420100 [Mucor lusitanicus]
MNPEQASENKQLQDEEMMALEAIFPEAFERDPTSATNAFKYTLNLDQDEPDLRSPRKVVLRFFLPPTYPNQDMPVYELSSIYCGTRKIDDAMLDEIDAGFQSLFHPTEVVLFEWISWLRDYLEDQVANQDQTEDNASLTQSMAQLDVAKQEDEQAFDYNPEDYVYKKPVNDDQPAQDQDEAHDRPTNVVVVVTRWFGGIHLGPDRFKDINNVARMALDECGYIKDKHVKGNGGGSSSNKHKKSNKK